MWKRREAKRRQREGMLDSEAARLTEQAMLLFYDADYEAVLPLIDRAVQLTTKAHGDQPRFGSDQYALGDRLRWRAETHQALGDPGSALRDATRALALFEAEGSSRYPLLIPMVHVQLSLLYAVLGDAAESRRHGESIEPFRESLVSGGQGALLAAKALAEYATAMWHIGERDLGTAAARESIAAYRSDLGSVFRRDSRITFARIVYQLSLELEPPDPRDAMEVLLMLQDIVEQLILVIPWSLTPFAEPRFRTHGVALLNTLERQGVWAAALDEPQLAARFQQLSQHLLEMPTREWRPVIEESRTMLETRAGSS
ncbi:hypothetical protein OG787_21105 [Streptomyces sp. NBC_00075]|uniref:hypothetical protein n=1 Tax=Streptomyces sp. NBC_00075 TaxID=2975641 RepID=UPI00324A2974